MKFKSAGGYIDAIDGWGVYGKATTPRTLYLAFDVEFDNPSACSVFRISFPLVSANAGKSVSKPKPTVPLQLPVPPQPL